MDYIIKDGNSEILIEEQSEIIRDSVIDGYIAARKAKGLTQQDVADITGILRPNIARIESKKCKTTIDVLVKLADAVDMRLDIKLVPKKNG